MRRSSLIAMAAAGWLGASVHAQVAPAPERRPGTPVPKVPKEDPPKKDDFKPAPVPPQPGASLQICKPFGDVRFTKDKPELGDKSSESCVLREDTTTKATDLLLRLPPGFVLPPHWHSANVTHTVISGTYEMSGEGPNATKVTMPAGTFNYTPAGIVHEGRVQGSEPVVMLVTFDRARDTKLLDKDGAPPRGIGEGQVGPRPQLVWVRPEAVKWQPFGQGVPAEAALLYEDPGTHASYLMLRVKGAMYVPRHWHPTAESLLVLSGSYTLPCGSSGKAKLTKGSYAYLPPKLLQNGWVGGEGVTLLICSDGPWKTEWVENPTMPEDPQEKKE